MGIINPTRVRCWALARRKRAEPHQCRGGDSPEAALRDYAGQDRVEPRGRNPQIVLMLGVADGLY
jgi:hypothetical protein